MIWATVSSWSCFCWLYRASPSLAAKNIIDLILVLTIWWCPCVESSLVLLEEGVCYDQCILLAKLYEPLPCFILYSKAKFACYFRYFLTSYFCIPVPYNEKDIFSWVLALEYLVGLHRTYKFNFSFFSIAGWGNNLDYCDIMVCLGSKQIILSFEIASKYCILDSFVAYDGYSISSMEFLHTVVDIMVWVKFTHSIPF